jgi:hypothetical protein
MYEHGSILLKNKKYRYQCIKKNFFVESISKTKCGKSGFRPITVLYLVIKRQRHVTIGNFC